jgi:hypothetical protein
MEKIIYQGKPVETHLVNSAFGHLNEEIEGQEQLYRDAEGTYYFQRTAFDGAHDVAHRVRRVSLTAAILWAIERTDPSTSDLRRDAAAALAGHGHPSGCTVGDIDGQAQPRGG